MRGPFGKQLQLIGLTLFRRVAAKGRGVEALAVCRRRVSWRSHSAEAAVIAIPSIRRTKYSKFRAGPGTMVNAGSAPSRHPAQRNNAT